MIIDFHTHIYPDHLAGRVIQNVNSMHVDNYCDGTAASLRRSMQEAGVTHSVILNIATKVGQTKSIVEFSRSLLKAGPDASGLHFIPFASVHPYEADWKYWLHKIRRYGFRGIKLHPDYQEFYIDDPALEPFYNEVAQLGLILVFHAGFDISKPNDTHATPRRIANVLPLLEKGTTVLAHMGGYAMFEESYELLCGHDIYLDNSYHFEAMDRDLARRMFLRHSPERILFGSDSPWCSQKVLLDYFMQDFAYGFLSEEDVQRVLWRNAAGLLRLAQPAQ